MSHESQKEKRAKAIQFRKSFKFKRNDGSEPKSTKRQIIAQLHEAEYNLK